MTRSCNVVKSSQVGISLPDPLKERLKSFADSRGLSLSALLREFVFLEVSRRPDLSDSIHAVEKS